MATDRRGFLRTGLAAAGAAAGLTALGVAAKTALSQDRTTAGKGGPTTPVLTPDGKLIHIDAAACCPAPASLHEPSEEARRGIPGRRWVMVVDLSRCDGCGKCTQACSKMHHVPSPREWIKVFEMQDSTESPSYWFPKPCFHCDNPPCTKVCPVGATFKRQDGIVLVDNERCIGCRFCMAACPYSSRYFNWGEPQETAEVAEATYSPERGYPRRVGTVEKCDFCPDMAAAGKLPGCVAGCPMGTLYYGDQNEDAVTNSKGETERLSSLLKERAGYRFMEELGTEPRVFYLPPKNRLFPAPGEKKAVCHDHEMAVK